ncbi:MAG: cytidylate kinase-like family protein [Bacteroidales bacterium]|nr:cytidylate kinase-like family protein [Bacteroidales bacterium]MBD5281860.1 cytidylate kinase-like family protein [Bacteroides sp.]MDE6033467.1 cytidylate kinase-like family protein [Muribaculaceae bacterium]MBD5352087.1 cytidylate kinase-like family protein [Bacteroides sp.]MBD5364244.1 cytidylate kinase-like family protein [Bacteroides sp.]
MDNFVITVGRQMGSGGRELGRLLAERLGIEFFDKKLLLEAAAESGLIPELMEREDERGPGFFSGTMTFTMGLIGSSLGSQPVGHDAVYRAQSEVIRRLGQEKSCVIVGRTADYVLRDHPRCINIFVSAPEEACVQRLLSRGDKASEAEARAMVRKINKLRSSYYNFYTDRQWGMAATYDLTVNSALMPMDQLADFVTDYVRRRLSIEKSK